ncbi:MAG: hypothetical protein V1902_02375 [Candidatus Falkowbacteria bacterium]
MDKSAKILRLASETFDVAGANGNILILGLETKPGRDLNQFETDGEKIRFTGFYKHFSPKTRELIKRIAALGHTAKQLRYFDDINLKRIAAIAGLGAWGKSSLVIHPKFGPRLRFVVLELNLQFVAEVHEERTPFTGCENCDACIRACPANVLRPFVLTEKEKCQAYIDLCNPAKTHRCDICQTACPAGR